MDILYLDMFLGKISLSNYNQQLKAQLQQVPAGDEE
jgi:hypothetical protein